LPLVWGTVRHASVDGTKWELYEQNLLSEQHIRYGGYGGIGLYLLSSTYIALMVNLIACSAWEGHYVLDVLEQNQSTIQPSIMHSDTQGQNEAIFGLAFLRGIELMPRIRNWQDLILTSSRYTPRLFSALRLRRSAHLFLPAPLAAGHQILGMTDAMLLRKLV
jgi:TnpA family transposase